MRVRTKALLLRAVHRLAGGTVASLFTSVQLRMLSSFRYRCHSAARWAFGVAPRRPSPSIKARGVTRAMQRLELTPDGWKWVAEILEQVRQHLSHGLRFRGQRAEVVPIVKGLAAEADARIRATVGSPPYRESTVWRNTRGSGCGGRLGRILGRKSSRFLPGLPKRFDPT